MVSSAWQDINMTSDIVANNPAGRLRDILKLFGEISGNQRPIGQWWGVIASEIGNGADDITFRAEQPLFSVTSN
jgi:hypothetical protein